MDRWPGVRLPSPQEPCSLHLSCPCRRHTPPSPGAPRKRPESGSRNLKPMRLGGTLGVLAEWPARGWTTRLGQDLRELVSIGKAGSSV